MAHKDDENFLSQQEKLETLKRSSKSIIISLFFYILI